MAEVSRKESSGGTIARLSKIKKSKSDDIRSAIGVYLKHKNYVPIERFRKSDLTLSQTKHQFMFKKMIDEDVSKSNSFLYSNVHCLTSNPSTIDQQFTRFVKFVQMESEPIKEELVNLFGPLICHLYTELLKGQEYKPAKDFLRKFVHLVGAVENYEAPISNKVNGFPVITGNLHDTTNVPPVTTNIKFSSEGASHLDKDYFKSLIQILSTCVNIENIESSDSLCLFRSGKYEINLTLAAVDKLRKYLGQHGHVLILNILHTWIQINIIDLETRVDTYFESIIGECEEIEPISNSDNYEQSSEKKSKEDPDICFKNNSGEKTKDAINNNLRKLKHSNLKMQKVDIPTRCFKISDPEKRLTSCNFDSNECHLVTGLGDSVINLYQLDQQMLRGRNIYAPIVNRCCPWNYNEIEEVSSDEENMQQTESSSRFAAKQQTHVFDQLRTHQNSFDEHGSIALRGHSHGVTDVMFSSHYPLLISVSKDKTMRAWHSSSYSCASIYKGHNYPVWCVSESPINMYMATGSKDLTARLWSLDRAAPLITYVGHTQDVDCLAFHPNGSYIATGSCDLSVRLWSVTDGKLFRVFTDCKFPISSLAFSPNGKLLAAAGEEQKIRIFDLAAGSQMAELKDHTAMVTSIAWNSSGKKFASSCSDGTIRMWDVSKLSTNEGSSQSTVYNKIISHASGCSNAIKLHFNRNDTITCIGRK